MAIEEVLRGTYIWFWTVFGHKRHSEVGAEEGPGEPASSFPRSQFLSHHDSPLKDTLSYICRGNHTRSRGLKGQNMVKLWDKHGVQVEAGDMFGKHSQCGYGCVGLQSSYITGRLQREKATTQQHLQSDGFYRKRARHLQPKSNRDT